MSTQYANLTLYGVKQNDLIDYISILGRDSYVSPTENDFTTIYDFSFEAVPNDEKIYNAYDKLFKNFYTEKYADETMQQLKLAISKSRAGLAKTNTLDEHSESILKQYAGTLEGILVCWASHFSAKFSCPAFATLLKSESRFWYHLSQDGSLVDEYTTYANKNWQPGQPILTDDGAEIKGGDARKICAAFNRQDKIEEIEIILQKPHGWDSSYSFTSEPDYNTLLQLKSFPGSIVRHHALSLAIGISPWWVLYMNYSSISKGEVNDYFDDYTLPYPSGVKATDLLKQSQPK